MSATEKCRQAIKEEVYQNATMSHLVLSSLHQNLWGFVRQKWDFDFKYRVSRLKIRLGLGLGLVSIMNEAESRSFDLSGNCRMRLGDDVETTEKSLLCGILKGNY